MSGRLVFHAFVVAADRGLMGSEFFWQAQQASAPVGSVAAKRTLEERVAELTEQFRTGLEAFAEKVPEKTAG